MTNHLFVYGTLLSGIAPPALAHLMTRLTYQGPANLPGRLYDFGLYPGAIPDAAADMTIHGELYALDADQSILPILDNYEGHFPDRPMHSLFRRVRVEVSRSEGRTLTAWMYAWNREADGGKLIAGGNYRAAHNAQRTTG